MGVYRGALDAKRFNQRGESRRLLPSAWIVEKEAWKGLTPAFEHADQRAAFEMRRYPLIRYEGEADAVKRCLRDQVFIVDNQRAVYRNREAFSALLEFPSV